MQFLDDIELLVIDEYTFFYVANETNGRNIEKTRIGYQISLLLQSNGIFDIYSKNNSIKRYSM